MKISTTAQTVLLTLVAIYALNQFDATRGLVSSVTGGNRFVR